MQPTHQTQPSLLALFAGGGYCLALASLSPYPVDFAVALVISLLAGATCYWLANRSR